MPTLNQHSLSQCADLLASNTCRSVDIVSDVLNAIQQHDHRIGAYIDWDADDAMRQARAADSLRDKGQATALTGIPIAVKDVLNVRGQTCRCGSRILEGYVSPYDATVIARLREAGAVFLGRVNMDEFAMGSSTENSAFGVTRNPWNLDRVPGGSSGGSAAAVAAREAIASLGSDTGGSVRQPASFCGCVGLKPSYGRVSRYGLTAYASSLDQVGPITRTVRDAALLLQCMAGADSMDSTCIQDVPPDYTVALKQDLQGMTLGLPKQFFVDGMDADVERLVREATEVCRGLGARVVDVDLPHTPYAIAAYYIIATAEASANLARFDGVRYGARESGADPIEVYERTRATYFGPEVKRRIILGTFVLSSGYHDAYYLRAQKVRTLIRSDYENVFKQCDALLTPVAPTPAYGIGEKTSDPVQMYLGDIFTVTANLAGLCGLSVPCGFSSENLPVGLQILGPSLGESAILRVGHAYEQASDWTARVPPEVV